MEALNSVKGGTGNKKNKMIFVESQDSKSRAKEKKEKEIERKERTS